jgi:hypothetical protein
METMQARKVVLLSYLVTMFVITFGSLWGAQKSFPKPSQYVGASIGFTTLAIGADFVPPVATAFAILFGFYMLSRNLDVVKALSNIPGSKAGSSPTPVTVPNSKVKAV